MSGSRLESREAAAVRAAAGPAHAGPAGDLSSRSAPPRTEPALARLASRLIRRGALLLALAVAGYIAIELVSYLRTYPDAASRAQIAMFQDSPAVRMLQGIPHGVETPGGFVVWDGGWVLEAIAGVWAMLVTSRLLRGEEDAERAELVLAAPVRAGRATLLQLRVVGAAALLLGAAAAAVLLAAGTGTAGSVIFGLSLAGFAATFAGVAAVSAQVFDLRRRAVTAAAAVFGLLYAVRMVANSTDSRGWLRWLTPFGWVDEAQPYDAQRWSAVVLLLAAPVLLAAVAVAIRDRRDTGGALLATPDRRRPRLRLLGSPAAFAWRSNQGVLLGWTIGLGAYAFVIGALVRTLTDYLASDPNYQKALEALGMDAADTTAGFVGLMGVVLGIGFALYACWRVGAARAEEDAGRVEHILTRPVPRWRWLGGHALLTLLGSVLVAAASGLAMWLGAALTGARVSPADAVGSMLNTVPMVVLFGGVAVLAFGVLPRLTVGLSVTAVVVSYVVELIGQALDWPAWVLDLSPFHHLSYVPAEPFAATAAAVMAALGVLAAVGGLLAFEHRDIVGA